MKNIFKTKRYIGYSGAVGVFLGVMLWLMSDSQAPATAIDIPVGRIQVSVVEPSPTTMPIYVEANGITQARWPVSLSATFSGHVASLKDNIHPGRLVEAGSVLVTLQDTQYRAELETARARVAEAELRLAEMTNEQHVVEVVGTAKTPYGRYEPHVKAARAQLIASQAALASAQQQLADTRITTPFPAVIIAEQVSPGQWINAGQPLFTLASSESLEIEVELSMTSWQRIGLLAINQSAQVFDPAGIEWAAQVRYLSPVMDSNTRQRSVILEVLFPYQGDTPLLPEQQVEVRFSGAPQPHVVRAPASVLTEEGKVWSVNGSILQLESIDLLDEQADYILFRYRRQPEQSRQLVRYPLSSMLAGQAVTVMQTAEESTS